ncbi:hypothetical protein [Flavobacterium gelidilacus]
MTRICIYPKDIQQITGKSERHARYIINAIKKENNKQKHQAVTIQEFCLYMGLQVEQINALIR